VKDIASILAGLAARDGDSPAVVDAADSLSFAGLDNWSNALAHQILAATDAEPKVCLVVAGFDRQAIVAMLAALKTPHIFVALDREIPAGNIATIATQLGAGLCVYSAVAEETVRAAGLTVPTLKVDTPPEDVVAPVPVLPDLTRTACFKRSSGSTGGAKTAAYSAESILIDAEKGAWVNDIVPGARYAVVSTFDSAMTAAAILRCLLAGATLMPVDLRFETPKQAADRLIAAGMTHIHATPTAFRLLTRGLPADEIFPDVHSVFLSGEKTTMADVRLLARTTRKGTKLRAAFSSSETQLVAHTTVLPSDDVGPEDFGELNVLDGVRIDILDDEDLPLPPGELGRVRVVSKMVSLGYRGDVDPVLAARFERLEDGVQSFLTDDIGSVTADGRLVLKSRAGREVKIRGRRVDLAELEAWLTGQTGISEAAVVVQPIGQDGDPRLAAFIKGEADSFEGVSALRRRMQSELVATMVPTAIVAVDELPRTPNQKIDRRALESDLSHLEQSSGPAVAADSMEGQVAKIWSKVLNRTVKGADDDFFELGGDSIAATVAAVMIEEELGLQVDTGFVYRYPVLSDQADVLGQMGVESASVPDRLLVPLTVPAAENLQTTGAPPARPARAFLISGAGGHVFPFAPLAQELLPDWELIGILHPGILKHEPQLNTVEDYAERMLRAMKALQPEGPYVIAGYSFGGAVAHEIGRRLSEAGETVGVAILDLRVPQLRSTLAKINQVRRNWAARLRQMLGSAERKAEEDPAGILEFDDPDLDPVERARLLISGLAMSKVLERYAPRKSSAPTILIKAVETRDTFDANDYGWGQVAPLTGIETTPGNHLNLFKGPHLDGFARLMRETLLSLERSIARRD